MSNAENKLKEMIRVAKPGAKLYIIDETSELIKFPGFIKKLLPKPKPEVFDPPLPFIPLQMINVDTHSIWNNRFWAVSFQKPR